MKKRVLAAVLATMMAATMMAGCGKSDTKSEAKKDSYTIGIEQFAEHGSLDNCREGFLKGLEDEGIKEDENLKVEYKNAAADMGTAGQISDSFVSDKVDLICAIATPSAHKIIILSDLLCVNYKGVTVSNQRHKRKLPERDLREFPLCYERHAYFSYLQLQSNVAHSVCPHVQAFPPSTLILPA